VGGTFSPTPQFGCGLILLQSGYEAYDRLSPYYKTFLEGLTAVHDATHFKVIGERFGKPLRTDRGAPDNQGLDLFAIHPVIRTNPVSGWKGLFVNGGYTRMTMSLIQRFTKRIVELTKDESDSVLEYLFRHISQNHDLQVRFKWNKNDIAIWDNRSTFHTATYFPPGFKAKFQ
jgi:alpha-ketoglutarate-dependent taurine dioxygenase